MSDPKYRNVGSPAMRLIEECGELVQAIAKGERFGWGNHHPDRTVSNLWELRAEWIDLKEAYIVFINHIENNKAGRVSKIKEGSINESH